MDEDCEGNVNSKTFFEWMIIDSGPADIFIREYSWLRAHLDCGAKVSWLDVFSIL